MRKLLCAALAVLFLLSSVSALADGPIEVTMLKSAGGNDTHIELWRELVPLFEAYTGGKYTLKMEEIPGVAVDVRTKYKMLNAANNLPAIVTDLGAEPAFADLLIANERVIDLKPYFDASPEWQATAFPTSVAFNTKDGKMFTTPATSSSYTGVYYNKELFAEAGIDAFPQTWDEFWAACDKLKAKDIPALSLHTTETGWCAMLWAGAYLGSTDAGNAFLAQRYPHQLCRSGVCRRDQAGSQAVRLHHQRRRGRQLPAGRQQLLRRQNRDDRQWPLDGRFAVRHAVLARGLRG